MFLILSFDLEFLTWSSLCQGTISIPNMEFRIQTCNIANSRSGLSHSSCHQTHYFIYKSKQLIDHWSWIVPSSRNQAKVDIGTSQAIRGICVSKFISSLRSNPSLVHQLQLNMGLPSPVNKKGRKGTRTYATRCDGPHQQVLIWVTCKEARPYKEAVRYSKVACDCGKRSDS